MILPTCTSCSTISCSNTPGGMDALSECPTWWILVSAICWINWRNHIRLRWTSNTRKTPLCLSCLCIRASLRKRITFARCNAAWTCPSFRCAIISKSVFWWSSLSSHRVAGPISTESTSGFTPGIRRATSCCESTQSHLCFPGWSPRELTIGRCYLWNTKPSKCWTNLKVIFIHLMKESSEW